MRREDVHALAELVAKYGEQGHGVGVQKLAWDLSVIVKDNGYDVDAFITACAIPEVLHSGAGRPPYGGR